MPKHIRILAALALSALAGCKPDPAGLVLVFPSGPEREASIAATIYFIKPANNPCSQYLVYPPPTPADADLRAVKSEITLDKGVPKGSLKSQPTGASTVLVNVSDATGFFLHGCKEVDVESGQQIEITLQALQKTDMATMGDGHVDDLTPPLDMTVQKILSLTVSEMRLSTRKLMGITVTVTDSAGTSVSGTTDMNGNVKLEVAPLVPPFTILANAPATNGYQGAVTISGLTPTFTTDTVSISIPLQLDPPPTAAGNTIPVTVTNSTGGKPYDIYYLSSNGLVEDLQNTMINDTGTITNLVSPGNYRVAVIATSLNPLQITTRPAFVSTGTSYSPDLNTEFHPYDANLQLHVVASGATVYGTGAGGVQKYGLKLQLPTSVATAPIPLIASVSFTATADVAGLKVPSAPNLIQPSAVIVAEMTADGVNSHSELRKQLALPTPANDSFGSSVPDPPVLTIAPSPSPSPTPTTLPITITAPLPGTFMANSTFVHVHVHSSSGDTFHWHLVAAAGAPTSVTLPAGIIPAGSYTVDFDFAQDISLADGTVQATLTDDYSKLIRPLPLRLSRSSFSLTVN
jgi:hypothetical protein